MKKYEGLFILNLNGKEEGIKDALDKISADITALGGFVKFVNVIPLNVSRSSRRAA